MLIVIRNEESLSQKTKFIIQLVSQNFKTKIFYVFKKESAKFTEKYSVDSAQLPSSVRGLASFYILALMKSPKDFRNGLMVRLSLAKSKHILADKGFLSLLAKALYLRFGTKARASNIMNQISSLSEPKIFLIDEFLSLNCLDLKRLSKLGSIIYVSQDTAHNRFGFGDNIITKKILFKLEHDALANVDLVVACSEMECLKYYAMGAKNVIFYPNHYPIEDFEPPKKDDVPSICIVLRGHWGSRIEKALQTILVGLKNVDRKLRVYFIGTKPQSIPGNVSMVYHEFLPSKSDYLKILGRSWIGINVGVHMAGTNERKYDYAEAGTIVFSDTLGARGDLLPHEYVYVDSYDLAAKLRQLLELDKVSLVEMGKENREHVLSLAEKERQNLLKKIGEIPGISASRNHAVKEIAS